MATKTEKGLSLDVGDVIYEYNNNGCVSKKEISRVTKTTAFYEHNGVEFKVKRVAKRGEFRPIPLNDWSSTHYEVESEKTIQDYKDYKYKVNVKNFAHNLYKSGSFGVKAFVYELYRNNKDQLQAFLEDDEIKKLSK
jgi:hypothetical protein